MHRAGRAGTAREGGVGRVWAQHSAPLCPPQTWTSVALARASTVAPASTSWGTSAACAQSPSRGPAARQVVAVPPTGDCGCEVTAAFLPGPAQRPHNASPAPSGLCPCWGSWNDPRLCGSRVAAPPHLLSAVEQVPAPHRAWSPSKMQARLPAQGSLDWPPPSLPTATPGQARDHSGGAGKATTLTVWRDLLLPPRFLLV